MALATLAPQEYVRYRRHRFVAKFPRRYIYSPAHFWLVEDQGMWHVGLTHFAVRMLGEIVEFDVELQAGDPIAMIQAVKAVVHDREKPEKAFDLYNTLKNEK